MVLRQIAISIAGIAGLFAFLIILSLLLRKSPSRYYRKAAKLHKKGEYYYDIGDNDLANEYYLEAEHYRGLAESMRGM